MPNRSFPRVQTDTHRPFSNTVINRNPEPASRRGCPFSLGELNGVQLKNAKNRYVQIIERIFLSRYSQGIEEIFFETDELVKTAGDLGIRLPKNLGGIIYSFRYSTALPDSIRSTAPEGRVWVIRPAGRSRYCFAAVAPINIVPNPFLTETKIPDSTPGIVETSALSDKEALLAIVRHNRLIDIFAGVACYSLQNNLRTYVRGIGLVETDEIYVGLDNRGARYVIPIQAKGGSDKLNMVQLKQNFAVCAAKFPNLFCNAIAAQFMQDGLIALFLFEMGDSGIALLNEQHFRLVPADEITRELWTYRSRLHGAGPVKENYS